MFIYVICIANPIPQDTIANAYAIWCVAIYHCDILNYNTVGHMQTNKQINKYAYLSMYTSICLHMANCIII